MTLELEAHLNTRFIEEEERTWRDRLRLLNTEIQQTRRELRNTSFYAIQAFGAVTGIIGTFATLIPGALGTVVQAGIQLVTSTVAVLQAVAVAYASGVVTSYLAVFVQMGALMLATLGMAAALSGQSKLDSAAAQMQSAFNQAGYSIQRLTSVLGGFG